LTADHFEMELVIVPKQSFRLESSDGSSLKGNEEKKKAARNRCRDAVCGS